MIKELKVLHKFFDFVLCICNLLLLGNLGSIKYSPSLSTSHCLNLKEQLDSYLFIYTYLRECLRMDALRYAEMLLFHLAEMHWEMLLRVCNHPTDLSENG